VKSFIAAGVLPREAILTVVRFVEVVERTGLGKINKVALRAKYLG
jgi:acyl-CoA synthetase (AMP-forming)/AMP-acid ligase II